MIFQEWNEIIIINNFGYVAFSEKNQKERNPSRQSLQALRLKWRVLVEIARNQKKYKAVNQESCFSSRRLISEERSALIVHEHRKQSANKEIKQEAKINQRATSWVLKSNE